MECKGKRSLVISGSYVLMTIIKALAYRQKIKKFHPTFHSRFARPYFKNPFYREPVFDSENLPAQELGAGNLSGSRDFFHRPIKKQSFRRYNILVCKVQKIVPGNQAFSRIPDFWYKILYLIGCKYAKLLTLVLAHGLQ